MLRPGMMTYAQKEDMARDIIGVLCGFGVARSDATSILSRAYAKCSIMDELTYRATGTDVSIMRDQLDTRDGITATPNPNISEEDKRQRLFHEPKE